MKLLKREYIVRDGSVTTELLKKVYFSSREVVEFENLFEKSSDYQNIMIELEQNGRGYVTFDIGMPNRWRDINQAADYLRWCAEQIELIHKVDCPF